VLVLLLLVAGGVYIASFANSAKMKPAAPSVVTDENLSSPVETQPYKMESGGVGTVPQAGEANDAVSAAKADAVVAPDGADTAISNVGSVGRADIALQPRVIQTATMSVTYKHGRVNNAFENAQRIAASLNGYVASSSFDDSNASHARATVTIRVPAKQFDRAIEQLGEDGKVASVDVTSEDVTEEYVDVQSRLRHDRAVEGRLVALLAKAQTINETLAIQARLDGVQEQIEVQQGRLNYLQRLTDLSTITINMTENGEPAAKHSRHDWGVRSALRDSAEQFVGTINDAIVALGSFLPLALGVLVAWLIGRTWWRRRSAKSAA
jgi:hypothetical protein